MKTHNTMLNLSRCSPQRKSHHGFKIPGQGKVSKLLKMSFFGSSGNNGNGERQTEDAYHQERGKWGGRAREEQREWSSLFIVHTLMCKNPYHYSSPTCTLTYF